MGGVLAILFVVVPFAELAVIIQVGSWIGVGPTLLALVVTGAVGAVLVKREGIGVFRRAQARMRAGEMPGRELMDGALILFAGALLLTPGFLTDILGLALLVPPVRAVVRASGRRTMARRTTGRVVTR